MERPSKQIAASEEERLQLERLLNSRLLLVGQYLRIQIVLHGSSLFRVGKDEIQPCAGR